MKMLAKMRADTDEDMVLLFLAVFRALGWKSRLVINFVILPLKPPKEDAAGPTKSSDKKLEGDKDKKEAEEADPKPSTSRSEQVKRKSSSKSSKSSDKQPEGGKKTEEADTKKSTSKPDQVKRKSSCKSSRKSKSNKESFVMDQLDGSNDIERSTSTRRSSKSRSTREKERSKRKVRYEDDKEDFSPPKKMRSSSSSSHSSSKSREGNNNKRDALKEPRDSKKSRSSNGEKSRRCSSVKASSPSKLSSEALAEAARRSSSRPRPARKVVDRKGSESDDDFEPMAEAPTKRRKSTSVKTKTSAKTTNNKTKMNDYFIEVLVKGEWVCVDAVRARTDCAEEMEEKASRPMLYVLACNADSTVKDVTMRYAKNYMTDARKKRMDQASIYIHLNYCL